MKSLIAIADPWPKHTAGCCVRHEQEEETQNPRDQAAGGDCFCRVHIMGPCSPLKEAKACLVLGTTWAEYREL